MAKFNIQQEQALRELKELIAMNASDELILAASLRFVEASPTLGRRNTVDVTALFAGAGDAAVGRPIDVPVSLKQANAATFLAAYREAINKEVGERKAQVQAIANTVIGAAKAALAASAM